MTQPVKRFPKYQLKSSEKIALHIEKKYYQIKESLFSLTFFCHPRRDKISKCCLISSLLSALKKEKSCESLCSKDRRNRIRN